MVQRPVAAFIGALLVLSAVDSFLVGCIVAAWCGDGCGSGAWWERKRAQGGA